MTALSGQTALVTGGGTGIGAAIAIDLAAAGVKVTISGRRQGPLDETVGKIIDNGGAANAVTADMTIPEDIEGLASGLLESQNGVDILVNNAGFSSKVRSAQYISAAEWRSVMDVNTMGPAMLTKLLLPPMIANGAGDVVMISSMAAIRPGVMAGVVYSSAKVAAKAYMEVLAMEVKKYGIRCTTIYPGEVDTPILDNRALPPNDEARSIMMQSEDISAAVMMAVSLPRRAMVSEIAITATIPRDMTEDIKAALDKQSA
ncbi:MAG: SDR family NAD(P)-dependent oxidoreductase [bacterium]|nr:SDR family NAD(P)-dependent oxidoreductase [Gammaproteobacteria bacterium]HIL95929.1 SDR family NAD(P)-dependent oxidoreductase [Pseudomonadales bacterium]